MILVDRCLWNSTVLGGSCAKVRSALILFCGVVPTHPNRDIGSIRRAYFQTAAGSRRIRPLLVSHEALCRDRVIFSRDATSDVIHSLQVVDPFPRLHQLRLASFPTRDRVEPFLDVGQLDAAKTPVLNTVTLRFGPPGRPIKLPATRLTELRTSSPEPRYGRLREPLNK
jgi:hypothetical protein